MLIHYDIEQNTPDWDVVRAGKFSSSSASTFLSGEKTEGFSNLAKTVAWGRKYGPADEPSFKNKSTERGHLLEPEARDWYIFETGNAVIEAGFVEPQLNSHFGWSPDGLVFDAGGVLAAGIEIKSLEHKAFMDMLKTRKVPSVYVYQVQWAMWVAKLQWLDFIVYHPQASGLIIPCYPDQEIFARFEERLPIAEALVQEWIAILVGGNQEQAKAYSQPELTVTDFDINF